MIGHLKFVAMLWQYVGIMPALLLAFLLALLSLYQPAVSKVGQELHIFSNGDVHMVAAEVVSKHALNLISVEVWDQKWVVPLDQYTKLETENGGPLKLEDILQGHKLEIKGRPMANKTGWIDARLVRDMDIKTGDLASPSQNQAASIIQAPTFAPPPQPPQTLQPSITTPSSPKRKLTQYLQMGMRGGEVIILQEFLQKNGWGIPDDGPVTGFFGKVTRAAVINFQTANKLPPEGVVGPKTRALINALLK